MNVSTIEPGLRATSVMDARGAKPLSRRPRDPIHAAWPQRIGGGPHGGGLSSTPAQERIPMMTHRQIAAAVAGDREEGTRCRAARVVIGL